MVFFQAVATSLRVGPGQRFRLTGRQEMPGHLSDQIVRVVESIIRGLAGTMLDGAASIFFLSQFMPPIGWCTLPFGRLLDVVGQVGRWASSEELLAMALLGGHRDIDPFPHDGMRIPPQ